jgi:transposase
MGTKQTADFRQEAVRVALTSGLTRKQVASDFGIGFSTLSRWIRQDRMTLRVNSDSHLIHATTPV